MGLEHAVTIYVNGFRNIIDTAVIEPDPERERERYSGPAIRFGRLLGESLIAAAFWWLTLVSMGQLGCTGAELDEVLLRPLTWMGEALVRLWDYHQVPS